MVAAPDYIRRNARRGVEFYEDYKGFLQVVGTNLGVTVIVRGYVACEVIDVNMIRIIGPDATF